MEDMREPTFAPLTNQHAPRQRGRGWLKLWGIALSLTLTLGVGAFLGTMLGTGAAQAASAGPGVGTQPTPTTPPGATETPGATGTPGPCGGEVTVSHLTNRSITVTRADGSTATIFVTSKTHYLENGHSVSLSAIQTGSKVYVVGTCNEQGRVIHATSIEIVP